MARLILLAQSEGHHPFVVSIGDEIKVKAELFDHLTDENAVRDVKQIPSEFGKAFSCEEAYFDPMESSKPIWRKKRYFLQDLQEVGDDEDEYEDGIPLP